MNYGDGIVYSVPNQSMPGLFDFSLDLHLSNLYCNIELEDTYIEIVWEEPDDFYASAISRKDDMVVGSTAQFKESDYKNMKMLSEELGISEEEISKVIDKGNELHREFYEKK